jgi:hypothetical protein
MKRILGPLLLVVLVVGVGIAIFLSVREQADSRRVITVRGLIGSEKTEFFQDPDVIKALRKGGLEVEVEKAGSRQIATSFDLEQYDFVFPAGVPAAEKIRREQGVSQSYDVFFTPMAIASWKPIADLLQANGMVKDQGGYYTLDMARFIETFAAAKRWSDLPDNDAYDVNKRILISSTDVRTSNSAAMYLSLASFVANNNSVVQSNVEVNQLLPLMTHLFLEQGFVENSSAVPFTDYQIMGMGKAPLVMIYEAQFIAMAAAPDGGMRPEMVLIYPEPTLFTKHLLIPLGEGGEQLGQLLQEDPDLQRLAIEHGFRNQDVAYFYEFTKDKQLSLPNSLVNVIEPPSYEVLEGMIQSIERAYQ